MKRALNDVLGRFGDLPIGQQVDVEFEYRDARHYAEEIKLED